MSHHIYKHIELTGTSEKSMEDAVRNAIRRAGKTVHHMRWFQVRDSRGHIDNGEVTEWQVTLEVAFTLDE
jgi:hypothetical protein